MSFRFFLAWEPSSLQPCEELSGDFPADNEEDLPPSGDTEEDACLFRSSATRRPFTDDVWTSSQTQETPAVGESLPEQPFNEAFENTLSSSSQSCSTEEDENSNHLEPASQCDAFGLPESWSTTNAMISTNQPIETSKKIEEMPCHVQTDVEVGMSKEMSVDVDYPIPSISPVTEEKSSKKISDTKNLSESDISVGRYRRPQPLTVDMAELFVNEETNSTKESCSPLEETDCEVSNLTENGFEVEPLGSCVMNGGQWHGATDNMNEKPQPLPSLNKNSFTNATQMDRISRLKAELNAKRQKKDKGIVVSSFSEELNEDKSDTWSENSDEMSVYEAEKLLSMRNGNNVAHLNNGGRVASGVESFNESCVNNNKFEDISGYFHKNNTFTSRTLPMNINETIYLNDKNMLINNAYKNTNGLHKSAESLNNDRNTLKSPTNNTQSYNVPSSNHIKNLKNIPPKCTQGFDPTSANHNSNIPMMSHVNKVCDWLRTSGSGVPHDTQCASDCGTGSNARASLHNSNKREVGQSIDSGYAAVNGSSNDSSEVIGGQVTAATVRTQLCASDTTINNNKKKEVPPLVSTRAQDIPSSDKNSHDSRDIMSMPAIDSEAHRGPHISGLPPATSVPSSSSVSSPSSLDSNNSSSPETESVSHPWYRLISSRKSGRKSSSKPKLPPKPKGVLPSPSVSPPPPPVTTVTSNQNSSPSSHLTFSASNSNTLPHNQKNSAIASQKQSSASLPRLSASTSNVSAATNVSASAQRASLWRKWREEANALLGRGKRPALTGPAVKNCVVNAVPNKSCNNAMTYQSYCVGADKYDDSGKKLNGREKLRNSVPSLTESKSINGLSNSNYGYGIRDVDTPTKTISDDHTQLSPVSPLITTPPHHTSTPTHQSITTNNNNKAVTKRPPLPHNASVIPAIFRRKSPKQQQASSLSNTTSVVVVDSPTPSTMLHHCSASTISAAGIDCSDGASIAPPPSQPPSASLQGPCAASAKIYTPGSQEPLLSGTEGPNDEPQPKHLTTVVSRSQSPPLLETDLDTGASRDLLDTIDSVPVTNLDDLQRDLNDLLSDFQSNSSALPRSQNCVKRPSNFVRSKSAVYPSRTSGLKLQNGQRASEYESEGVAQISGEYGQSSGEYGRSSSSGEYGQSSGEYVRSSMNSENNYPRSESGYPQTNPEENTSNGGECLSRARSLVAVNMCSSNRNGVSRSDRPDERTRSLEHLLDNEEMAVSI